MRTTEDYSIVVAHDYSAARDRREERREIYQMVAKAYAGSVCAYKGASFEVGTPDIQALKTIELEAEAIYQGMLKFVGDKT